MKQMRNILILGLTLNAILATPILAADSTTSMPSTAPSDSAQSSKSESGTFNKKFEESSTITDNHLKAALGSLSRYSARFNLSYYGPPVGDLSALNQPNPDGVVTQNATALSGSVGMRYRLNSDSSLSLSVGVSDKYIFHDEQKFDINNPFLSYDTAFKLGPVQMLSAPNLSLITSDVYKKIGASYAAGYTIAAIYNLGTSRFAIGTDLSLSHVFFDRDYKKKTDGKVRRSSLSISPVLKYNATSKLSVQTSLGISEYNPRSDESSFTLYGRTISQRLGLGYAFTRDIYISPSLQFYPKAMALRTTTFNVSSIFSIL